MSDGWTDGKSRSLTNFLVNSPSGMVFIKSIDTSYAIKNSIKLFEMLDDIVNEIGEENVVQVVTDSASAYVRVGRLLEEKRTKLFWSPCAVHCIDLMLNDISELTVFKDTKPRKSLYQQNLNADRGKRKVFEDDNEIELIEDGEKEEEEEFDEVTMVDDDEEDDSDIDLRDDED
ncbi:uncharacterized protein LOC114311754 [Camellia sinensis]|uniref:uncharacterized protein LOC114311754 n=1 Tax=Camellia sinensis TaxID=4442 RepID=UPI001036A79D|nr:uncharacterized protein LOC114311754 [Camellia sinensis]